MAGTYRIQPDGAALVETPAGPARMAIDEAQLQELGYTPEPLPPELSMTGPGSGAVADASAQIPGLPGVSDALAGRLPAPAVPPAADQAPAPRGITNSPDALAALRSGAPTFTPREFEEAQRASSGKPSRGLRGGAEVREIDTSGVGGGGYAGGGGGGGRGVFVPGGDVRAGYTKQLGVGQDLIDETESALADASIDRKLAAQNIAERDTKRSEQMSGAIGRQIRSEENAIREQERRDRAMEADFAKRQEAIDKERAAIESLEIKPDTLFDKEDWAKVIGSIIAIVGEGAHGLAGSSGPSPIDRLNAASDRSVQRQVERRDMRRQNLAARETELERLEKHYGDPRLAAAELRDRQRALIQAYGQKMLTDAGATDALDKFRAQLAAWDEERALGRVERQHALGDKVVEQYQYQPGRVVGGAPAVKEADVQGLADDIEKAGLGEAGVSAGNIQDILSELPADGEIPTEESRNVLSRGARGVVDFFGGAGTSQQVFDSPSERNVVAKFARAKSALLSKLSGANIPKDEYARLAEGINATTTREGLMAYAGEAERAIQRRAAGVKAGFKPEVVQEYERRRAGHNISRRPSGMRAE
jgi:hypothetical protein